MKGERRKLRVFGEPVRAEMSIEPETLLDLPLQARSLKQLSAREQRRYRRARTVLAHDGGVRALLLANVSLAGLGVFEALLAQSWSLRFNAPEEMVRLAATAVEIALGFDKRGYGKRRVADLKARAWGELANAYRAADRLRSAEQAFGHAYSLLRDGTGDLYLKARLFELEASLFGTWREFPLALNRLTSLSNLYQDLGEPHLAGRAFIIRALYTFYSGEAKEAIELNQEGVPLIDRKRDVALFMLALHNHLLFLIDLAMYPEAKRALFDNRRNLIYKDRINALRLRGIEGRISYGLGELLSAEIAFRETKDGFADAGMSFHAALLSLELALVLRSQERIEEAEQEVIVARDIFLSLEVYREYLGSVIYLEESFRRREATAELIQATIKHIERKWQQVGPSQMR
jgi:tetratricopeptide (TPR) repeat protein